MIKNVERAMKFTIEEEEKVPLDTVTNFNEVGLMILIDSYLLLEFSIIEHALLKVLPFTSKA